MMKIRLPAYVSAAARLGVVAGVLDARRDWAPRLRDAHREHERLAAVLAIGGLEDVTHAVGGLLASRALPRAAVADLDPRPAPRTPSRFCLHLGPRREVRRAVHELGLDRAQLGLVGDEAVPVVALVLARVPRRRARTAWSTTGAAGRTASGGTCRPAPGSADSTACSHAEGAQRRTRPGAPPGPAAHDDDRVVAGRERPPVRRGRGHGISSASGSRCGGGGPWAWSIRNITAGVESGTPSTAGPASTRQRSGRSATTSADGGSPRRIDTSPKNSPRCERRALLAVDEDRGVALEDHVEPDPVRPWRRMRSPSGNQHLLEGVRDALELRRGEVGEQRDPGDRVGDLVTIGHAITPAQGPACR